HVPEARLTWMLALAFEINANVVQVGFMTDRRVRIRFAGWWFGWVFAALTVDVVEIFGLSVIRFEVVVRNRPCRRDAAVVFDLAEILAAQPEQCRAVELGIAPDVVIRVRM